MLHSEWSSCIWLPWPRPNCCCLSVLCSQLTIVLPCRVIFCKMFDCLKIFYFLFKDLFLKLCTGLLLLFFKLFPIELPFTLLAAEDFITNSRSISCCTRSQLSCKFSYQTTVSLLIVAADASFFANRLQQIIFCTMLIFFPQCFCHGVLLCACLVLLLR